MAGNAAGALDPSEVWRAFTGGAQCPVDSFAADWPFWEQVVRPIVDVRRDWLTSPGGLR